MSRPSDTIDHISDYLWWLLPTFLKRKARNESLLATLLDIWGEELGTYRSHVSDVLSVMLPATSEGDWLDRIARAKQILRLSGETDESLRVRVASAFDVKRKAGTIPGMIAAMAKIGYTVVVSEPNKGTSKWSRFVVSPTAWDGVVAAQEVFYQVANALRPAHTRVLVDSALPACTWDDWEDGVDEPLTLDDDGTLDDWTT